MRLFVSVDLDGLEEPIAAAQAPFTDLPGVDTTDPGQAHVTLKFLGEVAPDRLAAVEAAVDEAVDAAAVAPFEARVGGYGVFPSPDYISVVWTGIDEGSEGLTRLHEAVEERLVALGFDPEPHEFTPHATLARVRDARSKAVLQELVTERAPDVGRVQVDEIRLTESTLTDAGPVYETRRAVPL